MKKRSIIWADLSFEGCGDCKYCAQHLLRWYLFRFSEACLDFERNHAFVYSKLLVFFIIVD